MSVCRFHAPFQQITSSMIIECKACQIPPSSMDVVTGHPRWSEGDEGFMPLLGGCLTSDGLSHLSELSLQLARLAVASASTASNSVAELK